MQPYILGIDIGTGSTKAVAADLNGNILDTAQHYYAVKSPEPGYSEQEPLLILEAFKSCITDVVNQLRASPVAVSFSSAMHSVIMVDEKGDALADMITWADSRSEAIAQTLRDTDEGRSIYEISGTPIHAMTPLCKLMWLKANKPVLFSSTFKFVSIKEYIWYYLFREFQVDYAIASATGLFDIVKLGWNDQALALAGIDATRLSTPVNTTYRRIGLHPEAASALYIAPETFFVIGASDGCCANLGSFVTGAGVASLTIGTSGAVRITGNNPVYDYGAMIFNYLLNEKTYVSGGAVNNGGIVLNWLLKSFLDKKLPGHTDYDVMFDRIATVPAGSEGLLFLPYLYGERAPLWDTKTCGTFFNIKPQHTQAHFLRAGLEGICFAMNHVLQTLERSSAAIYQLNISGGFISSPVWTQMMADITGKKLVIVQQEDASAMGAIFLAMDAMGLSAPLNATINNNEQHIIPDDENHIIYDSRFEFFKKLYFVLKDTMHQIHGS